jgi:hypothetical protein
MMTADELFAQCLRLAAPEGPPRGGAAQRRAAAAVLEEALFQLRCEVDALAPGAAARAGAAVVAAPAVRGCAALLPLPLRRAVLRVHAARSLWGAPPGAGQGAPLPPFGGAPVLVYGPALVLAPPPASA